MKVKVSMYVDKNMAIKENKLKAGEVILEVDTNDLTQEERDELITLNSKGFSKDEDHGYYGYHANVYPVEWGFDISEATLENFKAALADHKRWRLQKEAEKIKAEREVHEWYANKYRERMEAGELLTKTVTSFTRPDCWESNPLYGVHADPKDFYDDVPGLRTFVEDSEALAFWMNLESNIAFMRAQKEKARRREEAERKAEDLKNKRADQIKTWVHEKGTESQKNRLEEGLLPDDEIIDLMRDEAYTPLSDIPRYEKLKAADVCICEYENCTVDYDVDKKESATEEEYAQLTRIRELLPDAACILREHTGESEYCENTVKRSGIMVYMTVGAFEFSREYAAT